MILLLHGDNTVASQGKIDQLRLDVPKEQYYPYEAKSLAIETLVQTLSSSSLFGPEKKLVVINNPLGNKTILEQIPAPSEEITLVFCEQKKLTPSQIKSFKSQFSSLTDLEFKSDNAIFTFVESIKPGDLRSVDILEKQLGNEAAEVIFTMLVRQFRLLLLSRNNSKSGPDDWQKLSSWQLGKISSQAKAFSPEQLRKAYVELEKLDYQNKTGQLPYSLMEGIKFFLIQL